MTCPLPASHQVEPTGAANRGLKYTKFFDAWPIGNPEFKLDKAAKSNWVGEFTDAPCGDGAHVAAAAERRAALVERLGGRTEAMVLASPFVTGLGLDHPIENGFLWHHTLGIPYLLGSGVKGLVRAWAEHWLGEDDPTIRRLFGGSVKKPAAGNLIVFDALPTGPVKLMAEVMTPHDGGWRMPGSDTPAPSDWVSPKPIPFLAVAPDTRGDYPFQFAFAPRAGAEAGDVDRAIGYLKEALDWLGAGAKTAVGFGRFEDEDTAGTAREAAFKRGDRVEHMGNSLEITEVFEKEGKKFARLKRLDNGRKYKPKALSDLNKSKE